MNIDIEKHLASAEYAKSAGNDFAWAINTDEAIALLSELTLRRKQVDVVRAELQWCGERYGGMRTAGALEQIAAIEREIEEGKP